MEKKDTGIFCIANFEDMLAKASVYTVGDEVSGMYCDSRLLSSYYIPIDDHARYGVYQDDDCVAQYPVMVNTAGCD